MGGPAVWTGVDMVPEEERREAPDERQFSVLPVDAGDVSVVAFGDGGCFGALGGGLARGFS